MNRSIWQRRLGDLFLLAGLAVLLGVALFWAQSALAARQIGDHRYLVSTAVAGLPLPTATTQFAAALDSPEPALPAESPAAGEPGGPIPPPADQASVSPAVDAPSATQPSAEPAATQPLPEPTATQPPAEPAATQPPSEPAATPVPAEPPPAPVPPQTQPVVRIEIPALNVQRAVVPVGLKADRTGQLEWDTDQLFATRNREDLVGQLIASLNPGQGGNIILIGHNYDQGIFAWNGVFVNLKTLQGGDKIIVSTADGGRWVYIVQLVKKVPWNKKNAEELEKHMKFLGPSESERLTLVTCGGANIYPWPARIYVVAVPEGTQ